MANRDNVPSYTEYGGLIIDANNDGRTAQKSSTDVARLRLIYTFTSRMWLRLIGQVQRTERDHALRSGRCILGSPA